MQIYCEECESNNLKLISHNTSVDVIKETAYILKIYKCNECGNIQIARETKDKVSINE